MTASRIVPVKPGHHTMRPVPPERPAHPEPPPTQRGILCPYCGTVSATDPKRCDRCGGFFDPLSRQATQNAMGPWFLRDPASPFRPGCSFETLRDLIKRGKVTRDTILRGPSTRQYWNFASRTPGIANLLGFCHNCHVPVKPDDFSCTACGAVFTPETDRQHMGLAPVHLLPGQASPEIIAAASVDQARRRPSVQQRPAPQRSAAPAAPAPAAATTGLRTVAFVLLGLVLVGAVAAGVARFVLPVIRLQSTQPPPGTSPSAQPAPVERVPSPAPEVPSTQMPPAAPTGPAESAPSETSPPPAPRSASGDAAILSSLLGETFDGPALLRELETLGRTGTLENADAWIAIVRQRGEHERLRALP